MAILKQTTNGASFYLGWYGKCEETDCTQEFDLASEPAIVAVYKAIGTGFESYSSTGASFLNNFSKLKCGEAYYIVISKGTENKDIDIPDLTIVESNPDSEELKPLIKMCGSSVNTPTPVDGGSDGDTPKKTMKLPIILIAWDTGDSNTSLHYTSNTLLMGGSTRRYATKLDVEEMLNKKNYSWPYAPEKNRPTGSANDYYKAISFNQLDLQFEILPAGTDPNPKSNNLNDWAYIIREDYRLSGDSKDGQRHYRLKNHLNNAFKKVIANLMSQGRNFFDPDEAFWTGVPLTFFQPGFSASNGVQNRGDFIWAHKWAFSYNGRAQVYNINPFLNAMTGKGELDQATISSVGVIVHESLHAFGLPDLYDRSYKGAGINKVSVMSSGSHGNSNAWSAYLPGYIMSWSRNYLANSKKLFDLDVTDVKESITDVELFPSNDVNRLYKVVHPEGTDQWWLEYRTPDSTGVGVNFDKLLPESGLAIIHESLSNTSGKLDNRTKAPLHRRGESGYYISLEQRDGKFQTHDGRRNIQNDFYRPGDEFSPYTVPSSVGRGGNPSGIKIHNIRKTNKNSLLVDIEFVTEPNSRIISVDYSWANLSYDINKSERSTWKESSNYGNLSVTIKTENIPNGTTIKMHCNPGYLPDPAFEGTIQNNECVITFTGAELDSKTRENSSGISNYIKYFVADGDYANTFPWVDFLTIKR